MKRTLVLRRESLAALSAEDLGGVAGAQQPPPWLTYLTCPITDCLPDMASPNLTRLTCQAGCTGLFCP